MEKKSFSKKLLAGVGKKLSSLTENPYKDVNINWFKLKYYKHLPAGEIRKHKMFGSFIYFINPAELLHGLEEIFIEKIYKQELTTPIPYIIDCGANIGLSVLSMKQQYPQAEILAFEPDEQNFTLLSRNTKSYKLTNLTLKQEAIWIENSTLKFSNEGSMGSRIDDVSSSTSHEVKAVRLKDFLNRPVDFLKIDIEGAEYKVLMDLSESLKVVRNLFVEYHGLYQQNDELTNLFVLFTEMGFNYYVKEATGIYKTPFTASKDPLIPYDVQLNIFCFRK